MKQNLLNASIPNFGILLYIIDGRHPSKLVTLTHGLVNRTVKIHPLFFDLDGGAPQRGPRVTRKLQMRATTPFKVEGITLNESREEIVKPSPFPHHLARDLCN